MNKHIPCKRCSGRGFINWTFSEENTGTATSYICPDCNGSGDTVVPMTNADRIRAMSDEQLVKFMQKPFCDRRTNDECRFTYLANCDRCMMDWLLQPAEEEQL